MYIFKLFVLLLIVPLVYASLTFAQVMPQMPLYTAFDEFDVMSLYEPYELDNDYEEFQVMGVGDTQGFGLGLGSNWQEGSMGLNLGGTWQQGMSMGGESAEWQPQLGKGQQQPVTLGMIYQQLNPVTQPEQQIEEKVEKYYVDENIVRPRVVQGQPVVIPRYQKQPITRIQPVIQPVVRRIVRQKVIRPHILERTEVRPQILEQPVIVPRYFDQQKTHQQFREEHVEGAPIRLQPTYQSEKVRGTPVYGTLPARYQQPMQTKQQYQAPRMTKGQFSPNF